MTAPVVGGGGAAQGTLYHNFPDSERGGFYLHETALKHCFREHRRNLLPFLFSTSTRDNILNVLSQRHHVPKIERISCLYRNSQFGHGCLG